MEAGVGEAPGRGPVPAATGEPPTSGDPATAAGEPGDPAAAAGEPDAGPVLPVTVVDDTGRTVVIESVERVISLDGDITEVVFAFGLGDRGSYDCLPLWHTLLPVTQDASLESTARHRLRSLRLARGWSIDQLARRSHLSASTISRIETGHRRLAIDHLVTLARALDTSVDELLLDESSADDVVIRPTRDTAHGATYWLLTRHDDPSGRTVAKMRLPAPKRLPPARVHPGREWFYVLDGTVRLVLGDREHLVRVGQAADFDTMTPHRILGHGAPAEILTIFDRHGEQAHLRPS